MVVVQTTVDERGRIVNPVIVRHSEPEFEAAALEALRQWEYAPATLQDKPVPVMIKIAINFSAK
jgi:TonB family protein